MKNTTYLLLLLTSLVCCNNSFATVYLSKSSGNYSSSSTWVNGITPPPTVTGNDTVKIKPGHQITMDTNIRFTGANAALIVEGTLLQTLTPLKPLTIDQAYLYCSGNIYVRIFEFDSKHPLTLSNASTIKAVYIANCGNLVLTGNGSFEISSILNVQKGILTSINNSEIKLYGYVYINMKGGSIVWDPTGSILFPYRYTVYYHPEAKGTNTSFELFGGNSLQSITVDVGVGNELLLASSLVVQHASVIKSGILKLNSNDLHIIKNGSIHCTDTGWIHSTAASNITLSGAGGPNIKMRFIKGGQTVGVLNVNQNFGGVVGTVGAIHISTDLKVEKQILLQTGYIYMGNNTLFILKDAVLTGGSDTSYIIADQDGSFSRYLKKGQKTLYPIGTSKYYQPLEFTANDQDHNNARATTIDDVFEYGYTGSSLAYLYQPYVAASWYLRTEKPTFDIDMQAYWYIYYQYYYFDDSHAYISRHDSIRWDKYTAAPVISITNYKKSLIRKNVKNPGVFTILDGNAVLSLTEALATEKTITLYPNPAKDVLHVQGVSHGETVEVYNSLGQLVQTEVLRNNSINVSALSAGVYYLTVDRKEKPAVISFVKQAQ